MRHTRLRIAVTAMAVPLALSAGFATSAQAKTRAPECVEGPQWTSSVPGFTATSKYTTVNRGSKPTTNTFSTEKDDTVALEASASLEVEGSAGFGAFSASVKAQVGVTASKSQTVKKGFAAEVTNPAKRKTVVQFGVTTRRLKGVYLVNRATLGLPAPTFAVPGLPAGCQLRGLQNISATVPIGPGYKVKNYRLRKKG